MVYFINDVTVHLLAFDLDYYLHTIAIWSINDATDSCNLVIRLETEVGRLLNTHPLYWFHSVPFPALFPVALILINCLSWQCHSPLYQDGTTDPDHLSPSLTMLAMFMACWSDSWIHGFKRKSCSVLKIMRQTDLCPIWNIARSLMSSIIVKMHGIFKIDHDIW